MRDIEAGIVNNLLILFIRIHLIFETLLVLLQVLFKYIQKSPGFMQGFISNYMGVECLPLFLF
jgi:hypothetical protein